MEKKPLLLRIFTLLLLIEPLVKIVFLAINNDGFNMMHIASRTFDQSWINIVNFWLIFPILGLSLIKLNPTSFFIFLSVQIYSMIFHLSYEEYAWPYLDKIPQPTSLILLGLNTLIIIYVLLPRTREIFFNENIRWWERGGRFIINKPCTLYLLNPDNHETIETKATINNISYSGVLLSLEKNLVPSSEIKIEFEVLDYKFNFNGTIVRETDLKNKEENPILSSYALSFNFKSILESFPLRVLIFKIESKGIFPKYR